MSRIARLFRTSIGRKVLMALSGGALVLFMLGHMLGNLTIYKGQDAINGYADWLQGHPLLWVIRMVMLTIFLGHLADGVRITLKNRAARPLGYRRRHSLVRDPTARFMLHSGMLLLLFLAFHLAHLTLLWSHPELSLLRDAYDRPDVYARVVTAFSVPWIAAVYLAGLALLGVHLHHAVQSLMQTLGIRNESYQPWLLRGAILTSHLIWIGLASIPLAVQLGRLPLPAP